MTLRRSGAFEPVCHWCKRTLAYGVKHNLTTPKFSSFGALPIGTGVVVCGPKCPNRPDGAPVGAEFKFHEIGAGV